MVRDDNGHVGIVGASNSACKGKSTWNWVRSLLLWAPTFKMGFDPGEELG